MTHILGECCVSVNVYFPQIDFNYAIHHNTSIILSNEKKAQSEKKKESVHLQYNKSYDMVPIYRPPMSAWLTHYSPFVPFLLFLVFIRLFLCLFIVRIIDMCIYIHGSPSIKCIFKHNMLIDFELCMLYAV